MSQQELDRLPGAEIVLPGIEDVAAGRETVNAFAVRAAASRLGVQELVGDSDAEEPAAHRLYLRLSSDDIDIRFEPDSDPGLRRIAELKGGASGQRRIGLPTRLPPGAG